ncbi:SLC13 family permease [Nocardioides abyssi]|uniref:ArsB/NhaD family transporter n=1 Tax=Nocardioides abyssi TaxID=3058370 RepID=A0ABT8EYG0_9ACTN|nr:SLC13 family permease [Nocardioides abyssi]MDN4163237.1 ArsB/NhaD family transporter [Nocardioides abyssi]
MVAGAVVPDALVDAVGSAWTTTWPVLAFLLVITLVSDLCADARLFDVAASLVARLARGRTPLLFAAHCLLATVVTVLLGIDTTAVMLTPVSLALAAQVGVAPLPFAFATVWLANAASLLLPISNLTNLLAVERTGSSAGAFVTDLWLPQLVVLAVVLVVLGLRHRTALAGTYAVPRTLPSYDAVLVAGSATVALGIAVATVLGAPAWAAATGGLAVLVALAALRSPDLVRPGRLARSVPAVILVGTFALFTLVELLVRVLDPGPVDWPGPVAVAGAAALLSNLVNNLPAWLALAPLTGDALQPALLVGVNTGGMLLLWGSLANLLWRRRCRLAGLHVSGAAFLREGLLVVPLSVVLGALVA